MNAITTAAQDDEMIVPTVVLLNFFQNASKSLEEYSIDIPRQSSSDIRHIVLKVQTECLEKVVKEYNNNNENTSVCIQKVQDTLKDLAIRIDQYETAVIRAMEQMNDTARLTYTRLLLQSEYLKEYNTKSTEVTEQDLQNIQNNKSEPMQRSEILEFCSLCKLVVQLPNVQKYLAQSGIPLFDSTKITNNENEKIEDSNQTILLPQEKLQSIQRMLLKAIGCDPDHGTNEIKRIFFSPNEITEYSDDTELMEIFDDMASTMDITLTNASIQSTHNTFFSDYDQGGVTRVVAVNYTEKVVDPRTGYEVSSVEELGLINDAAPTSQCMDDIPESEFDKQQHEQLRLAREASLLQQEILGELLSMREEERDKKLELAKQVVDQFMEQAMLIPPGHERVLFLQSMDMETQKLLAMHKLWESMLASHNGQPPTMR